MWNTRKCSPLQNRSLEKRCRHTAKQVWTAKYGVRVRKKLTRRDRILESTETPLKKTIAPTITWMDETELQHTLQGGPSEHTRKKKITRWHDLARTSDVPKLRNPSDSPISLITWGKSGSKREDEHPESVATFRPKVPGSFRRLRETPTNAKGNDRGEEENSTRRREKCRATPGWSERSGEERETCVRPSRRRRGQGTGRRNPAAQEWRHVPNPAARTGLNSPESSPLTNRIFEATDFAVGSKAEWHVWFVFPTRASRR